MSVDLSRPRPFSAPRVLAALPTDNPNGIGQSRLTATSSVTLIICVLRHGIAFARRQEQIRLHGVLLGVEVKVAATSGVERFMRAALDDASGFDHQDLLGAPNRREP